ncbi:glycosyl transferase family 2 [Marivita geojedonensis]|nr:glycosyltransferase family A protein [Marivita geojedonensis]PRY81483.1 glycosyl transferase family 2 [Marivita geojedonensis]
MVQFSVIVPTYNRLSYLKHCLESIAAQTCAPFEIIVVDDGSTDGTVEWLQNTHPEIRAIRQQNAGPGAARNRGAAEASGDYLAFLDSDDLWPPWALSTYRDLLKRYDRPSLLFARYRDFAELPDFGLLEAATAEVYANFAASHKVAAFAGGGMMVARRDAFVYAEGFPEDRLNGEDHDLALQLSDAPGFVRVVSPVTVAHRVHSGNEMGDVEKTVLGVIRLVEREEAGAYPGGRSLASARREIISRHARPAILEAAKTGHSTAAGDLYQRTLSWHLAKGRYKFLAAAGFSLAIRKLRMSDSG